MTQEVYTHEPDWKFLDQVIANIKNIEKKSVFECVREIYTATYYRYALKYHEQKELATKAEAVVLQKYGIIDRLQAELVKAYNLLDEHGIKVADRISIPERGFATLKNDEGIVVLQEGSEGSAGPA